MTKEAKAKGECVHCGAEIIKTVPHKRVCDKCLKNNLRMNQLRHRAQNRAVYKDVYGFGDPVIKDSHKPSPYFKLRLPDDVMIWLDRSMTPASELKLFPTYGSKPIYVRDYNKENEIKYFQELKYLKRLTKES